MAAIDFTDRRTLHKYAPRRRRRKKSGPTVVLLLFCAIGGVLLASATVAAATGKREQSNPLTKGKTQAQIEDGYGLVLQRIEDEREKLAGAYHAAQGWQAKRNIMDKAAGVLFPAIENRIIPFWYGTGYGFDGTSETPGVGTIACGYFVVTVLRDAGFRVERYGLSQQPSELIIQSLVDEAHIRRFSNLAGKEFLARLAACRPGLYVLGLDKHVGFLAIGSEGAFFIHSTLLHPYAVIREPAASSRAIMKSDYRVLGHLSSDERLITKWLGREKIATRK
jgi:hypothetical protein